MNNLRFDIIILTYKPDKSFFELIDVLEAQEMRPEKIIVINTEEKYLAGLLYGTRFNEEHKNVEIRHISRREFNHGRTRNKGAKRSTAPFMIFMTQDAIPADGKLTQSLLSVMEEDEDCAVSYARQLPGEKSDILERFNRSFNYPDVPRVQSLQTLEELGIKTYFCSDACACYRKSVFEKLGGFIDFTIFNEDMIYAHKAVNSGYKIYYVPEARVYHSHNYTILQQFRRNFDLGVSQADHPEVFDQVSSEKEGGRLVKECLSYLAENRAMHMAPYFFAMCAARYLGYRKGKNYKKLSRKTIWKYTANRDYWARYWDRNVSGIDVYAGYGKNAEGL